MINASVGPDADAQKHWWIHESKREEEEEEEQEREGLAAAGLRGHMMVNG